MGLYAQLSDILWIISTGLLHVKAYPWSVLEVQWLNTKKENKGGCFLP